MIPVGFGRPSGQDLVDERFGLLLAAGPDEEPRGRRKGRAGQPGRRHARAPSRPGAVRRRRTSSTRPSRARPSSREHAREQSARGTAHRSAPRAQGLDREPLGFGPLPGEEQPSARFPRMNLPKPSAVPIRSQSAIPFPRDLDRAGEVTEIEQDRAEVGVRARQLERVLRLARPRSPREDPRAPFDTSPPFALAVARVTNADSRGPVAPSISEIAIASSARTIDSSWAPATILYRAAWARTSTCSRRRCRVQR